MLKHLKCHLQLLRISGTQEEVEVVKDCQAPE